MALIGEMKYLTIGGNTYSIPELDLPIASSSTLGGIKVGTNLSIDNSTGVLSVTGIPTISITRNLTSGTKSATINIDGTDYDIYSKSGTVTSVQVQATSPVVSSQNTAQSSTLNTTISLADNYGDTKNPYASKTKNYVLAAPSNAAGAPSFRALVASDIPDLSSTYLTSYTETDPVFSASAAAGISSTDITNWNNKVSDTGKWNDVSLNKTVSSLSNQEAIIPFLWNSSDTIARFTKVSKVPSYNYIAQYSDGYLNSTTPTSGDSSTKVATTAFVAGAVVTQASIDSSGLITYKNSSGTSLFTLQLPLYNGGVS